MPKFNKMINPFTGNSLPLSINSIVGMILFVLVSLFSVSLAQKIGRNVESRASFVDLSPNPVFKNDEPKQTQGQIFV